MTKRQSYEVAETDEAFYRQPRPSLLQKIKPYLRMDFKYLQNKPDFIGGYLLLRNDRI